MTDPPAEAVRPTVAVSQCLGFAAVRYNGLMLRDRFVEALREHVHFIEVCPEIAIGLGVPRDPIRIIRTEVGRRLVQPATGRDVTERMRRFRQGFLDGLGPVDGFILKSRSPSCGIKDVKVYPAAEGTAAIGRSAGLFGEAVLERFPQAAVEDEGRLTHLRLRHHFLTRLYAVARLRQVREGGAIKNLVRFQSEYKLQLMAYGQTGLRELGRIVANAERRPPAAVLDAYAERLARTLARPPRTGAILNVLMHALGYVSERLKTEERAYFLELLNEYRQGRLPLSAVLSVLRAWIVRFEQPYLAPQRFFEPYPRALLELTESGGERP